MSNYLKQLKEAYRRGFNDGMDTGVQLMDDFVSMSLHDPNVMGKNRVMNRGSIDKIFANCSKLDDHFNRAFDTNDVEADYIREEMDAALRDIYEEDADPFEKRYPYAKEISYVKAKKGWVN